MPTALSRIGTRYDAGAPALIARGVAITTSGSTAYKAIPNCSNGDAPNRVRLAATAACYARMGTPVEAVVVDSAAGSGYFVGDTITLTGGTFSTPMKLNVLTAALVSAVAANTGTGWVPADTVTLAGGTAATKAILTVTHTRVSGATIVAAGTLGTPGAATVTGTTGTGTPFQATVTISAGGVITSVNSISVPGDYTVNPTDVTIEPVTGGSLSGATLALAIAPLTTTLSVAGNYSATPTTFTQFATSGSGTGATFGTPLFGVLTAGVTDPGAYTVDPSNPVAQGSSSGAGTSATFTTTMITAAAAGDMLVTPNEALVVDAVGFDHVAAIQVTAGGILSVSPIEN
jgi:hypothetical protein